MAVSDDFLEYVLEQLYDLDEVESRRMFGGAGLYKDDKMFGIIVDDIVYLKVDETNIDRYIDFGSKPLQPFKANKKKALSFYDVPADVFEDSEEFVYWAIESLNIQKKLSR